MTEGLALEMPICKGLCTALLPNAVFDVILVRMRAIYGLTPDLKHALEDAFGVTERAVSRLDGVRELSTRSRSRSRARAWRA